MKKELIVIAALAASSMIVSAQTFSVDPAKMPSIGVIDQRYQSYNIEMLEFTGGKFWKPYNHIPKPSGQVSNSGGQSGDAPAGMSADLYQYRPPIDLTNRRLRMLARALGPAYVRISGTWANTTYFADTDTPPKNPPKGYGGILTRQQWLGAIEFSKAVDAQIVTSVPNGDGTRGEGEVWQPNQARTWLAFTKAHGGIVAAAEYFNEPTLATMGGAPKDYDAAAFGRDFKLFDAFMRKEFPETKLLGPGSVGEANAPWAVAEGGYGNLKILPASQLSADTGDADAFSYHHYGAASQRCEAMGHQTTADQALSEDWLGRTDQTLTFYREWRDKNMPGKPFWNTETADAACGGNPWGGTFLDSFRYLDQLGRLARQDVKVVMHNTLDASDYGLLDENSYQPKPNYWAALLWRRLMGTTVLDSGVASHPGLHVYAQCLRDVPGGVAMLVINTDQEVSRQITLPVTSERYGLTATKLTEKNVMLNHAVLQLGTNDVLPPIKGDGVVKGNVAFAPVSITFLAIPLAQNEACR